MIHFLLHGSHFLLDLFLMSDEALLFTHPILKFTLIRQLVLLSDFYVVFLNTVYFLWEKHFLFQFTTVYLIFNSFKIFLASLAFICLFLHWKLLQSIPFVFVVVFPFFDVFYSFCLYLCDSLGHLFLVLSDPPQLLLLLYLRLPRLVHSDRADLLIPLLRIVLTPSLHRLHQQLLCHSGCFVSFVIEFPFHLPPLEVINNL